MKSIDILIENFNLDPMKDINIDPYDYFSENRNEEINQIYLEAKNATKGNIFEKLFSILKRAWAFISKYIGKIISWIKSLFTKKKKSADQILKEVIGGTVLAALGVGEIAIAANNKSANNGSTASSTNNTISNNQSISNTSATNTNSIQSIKLSIPSSDKSTVDLPDINAIFKPFLIDFDHQKNSITVNYMDLKSRMYNGSYNKDQVYQGPIIGQPAVRRGLLYEDWDLVMILILNPDVFDLLIQFVSVLKSGNFSSQKFINAITKFNNAINPVSAKYLSLRNDHNGRGISVSLNEISNFQVKLNEVNNILSKVDQPMIDAMKADNPDNETINILNNIVNYISRLQMGVNTLTSVITNSFLVDLKFQQSIKDTNKLAEFVQKCVDNGIPAKYISYNCYILADPSIKGDGSKGNADNPIWGQSRVVFFPPNKNIVHKVALSGWGVRANKSEVSVSEKFKSLGNGDALALVTNRSSNDCIIDAEKVDSSNKIPVETASNFINDVKNFCNQHDIPLDLTIDLSPYGHNLGIKNGKPVIIDYGIANRTSIGKAV